MTWFEQAEQKRKLVIGGITILCLAMLAVTARRNNVSLDSFWHLKAGLDWLQYDLSFWRDHFSFTFHGQAISGPPFMFQALIGWLVMQLGLDQGLEIYKIVGFFLTFLLVLHLLHKLRSPVIVYCLVLPLVVVLLQMRSTVRPELIGYSFSVLAILLYHRANYKISITSMLPIVGLLLLWGNYHTSIFGYIIFFGFFVDLAVQQFNRRASANTWIKWLLWGSVVFSVGFIKPGASHPVIGAIFFSDEWKSLILEYESAYSIRMYLLFIRSLPSTYLLFSYWLETDSSVCSLFAWC